MSRLRQKALIDKPLAFQPEKIPRQCCSRTDRRRDGRFGNSYIRPTISASGNSTAPLIFVGFGPFRTSTTTTESGSSASISLTVGAGLDVDFAKFAHMPLA